MLLIFLLVEVYIFSFYFFYFKVQLLFHLKRLKDSDILLYTLYYSFIKLLIHLHYQTYSFFFHYEKIINLLFIKVLEKLQISSSGLSSKILFTFKFHAHLFHLFLYFNLIKYYIKF